VINLELYEDCHYEGNNYYYEVTQNDKKTSKLLKYYFINEMAKNKQRVVPVSGERENRLLELEERMQELERKINFIFKSGISIEPMIVPDFPESEISDCNDKIEAFLEKNDSINPWKFAEENDLDVKLVLLCIDRLISEGRLEW
jgi:hypothetical protein